MKKRIKEWILRHEMLYWSVVAVVAGLVFGIVTAVGCGKLYDANAADITDYHANRDYAGYYETACEYMISDLGQDYVAERPYRVVVGGWAEQNNYCTVFFSAVPMDFGNLSVWHEATFPMTDCVYVYFDTGKAERSIRDNIYCDIICIRYTTYDIAYGDGSIVEATKPILYSVDAPYITFDRLSVKNLIADGETSKLGVFKNMYEDYTKASTWTYYGTLNNRDSADLEYLLEATFVVEIPTLGYVQNLAYEMDVNMEWEHGMLSNAPSMVYHWNNDDKALKNTYEFVYPIAITPDIDGHFSYQLPFDTIETLIMYWDEEARERINGYSDYWRAILLSYLHVDCVTVSVRTVRSDSIIYGKVTTNQFDRGIYDVCVEVIPDIDINTATPEEIDKIIADSLQDAHDKYLADLEQRLEDLEGQLNDVGSLDGAFSGSLEGTGLWSGFKSLAGGLASLGGTVSGISSAIGSVFGFLPVDIQYVMGYTILALCVIAIIKAIRG